MQIPMKECRNKLSIIWILGSTFIILFITLQTIFGKYGDKSDIVWSLFIPAIMPNLSLILGILATDAISKKTIKNRTVDRFFFRISLNFSILYLILLILPLLISPFLIQTPLEIIKQSKLWLIPLQGVLTGTLGAFFYKT